MGSKEEQINKMIQEDGIDTNKISDGYHTFGELYEHRITLFIALCNLLERNIGREYPVITWKSKKHHDGSEWDGWFIAGINEAKGEQISYHLPISKWDELKVAVYQKAPEWDGHTSSDVLERLKEF